MATRAVSLLGVVYIFGHFGPTQTVPGASNIGYFYIAQSAGLAGTRRGVLKSPRVLLRLRAGDACRRGGVPIMIMPGPAISGLVALI